MDLNQMARERERVFSLSKFSTMANEEDIEENETKQFSRKEIFNRIYAANDIPSARSKGDAGGYGIGTVSSDDEEYRDQERTSYPTN